MAQDHIETEHPVDWHEGVPVSAQFDDPFFSLADGWAETRHVFLRGNGLPERFRDGFAVGELGFGTGLNFLCCLSAWRAARVPGRLHFTSFEAYPMAARDAATALSRFPQTAETAEVVVEALAAGGRFDGADVSLRIVFGDARDTLPAWDAAADAWFLDGFSPAKNPEMWQDDLLAAVAAHTAPGGTFATYTAAGHVRRALEAAGFEVWRQPGYGRKRHMTAGHLR